MCLQPTRHPGTRRRRGLTLDQGHVSGVLSGPGGLTKVTSGILIRSGANTFTGPTLINSGSLEVAGSLSGSSIATATGSSLSVDMSGSISADSLTVPDSSNLTYTTLSGAGLINCAGAAFVNRAVPRSRAASLSAATLPTSAPSLPDFHPDSPPSAATTLRPVPSMPNWKPPPPSPATTRCASAAAAASCPAHPSSWKPITTCCRCAARSINSSPPPLGGVKPVTGMFSTVRFDADGAAGPGVPVSNAAVLFDQATGRVIATGLNGPTSTFADLGSTANQRQVVGSIFNSAISLIGPNQINSSTSASALALQLIASPGSISSKLANFTPEFYGSIADYAMGSDLAVTNLLHDRITNLSNIAGLAPDGFALFSGMM